MSKLYLHWSEMNHIITRFFGHPQSGLPLAKRTLNFIITQINLLFTSTTS